MSFFTACFKMCCQQEKEFGHRLKDDVEQVGLELGEDVIGDIEELVSDVLNAAIQFLTKIKDQLANRTHELQLDIWQDFCETILSDKVNQHVNASLGLNVFHGRIFKDHLVDNLQKHQTNRQIRNLNPKKLAKIVDDSKTHLIKEMQNPSENEIAHGRRYSNSLHRNNVR